MSVGTSAGKSVGTSVSTLVSKLVSKAERNEKLQTNEDEVKEWTT